MPVILIVDDSPVDQRLIGHLVSREEIDWVAEFAQSGEEAMVKLEDLAVDILVTDMIMPGMTGLELLQVVGKKRPELPVIVVTGQGSEEIAAAALGQGAASYVPKTELASRLNETIKQVLAVTSSRRGYETLVQGITTLSVEFQLGNSLELLPTLVHAIQQLLAGTNFCSLESQRRVGIALDEALINAVCHGSLELSAEQLREVRIQLRDGNLNDFVKEHQDNPKFRERKVVVAVEMSNDRFVVTVTDNGPGFDPGPLLERSTVASLEANAPRGLVLIKTLMDEVEFQEGGKRIVMTKLRETRPPVIEEPPLAID